MPSAASLKRQQLPPRHSLITLALDDAAPAHSPLTSTASTKVSSEEASAVWNDS